MSNLTKQLTGKDKEEYIKSRFPQINNSLPQLTNIKDSIKEELIQHINDFNKEDRNHYTMFNEDYYLIGYYNCEQWLKKHNLNTFDAISICNDYEKENFGEIQTQFDNAETLVNNLVYWFGQDICNELEISFDRE